MQVQKWTHKRTHAPYRNHTRYSRGVFQDDKKLLFLVLLFSLSLVSSLFCVDTAETHRNTAVLLRERERRGSRREDATPSPRCPGSAMER
jgi:hypothetical protein